MRSLVSCLVVLVISAAQTASSQGLNGTGRSERYWDCCKPDCSWEGKASFNQPAAFCGVNNEPLSNFRLASTCGPGGGDGFSCAEQSPWAVNETFAYGFAGVFIIRHVSDFWCCACWELSWPTGKLKGKKMVVQAHNAGFNDPDHNRFILAIPGGNTSFAGACANQWGVDNSVFGQENVGVATREDCDNLPRPLRAGCYFRFDWFMDEGWADVEYKRVACPAVLTNITNCVRNDDGTFSSAAVPSAAKGYSILMAAAALVMWMMS